MPNANLKMLFEEMKIGERYILDVRFRYASSVVPMLLFLQKAKETRILFLMLMAWQKHSPAHSTEQPFGS
jgi:hypothetical protein